MDSNESVLWNNTEGDDEGLDEGIHSNQEDGTDLQTENQQFQFSTMNYYAYMNPPYDNIFGPAIQILTPMRSSSSGTAPILDMPTTPFALRSPLFSLPDTIPLNQSRSQSHSRLPDPNNAANQIPPVPVYLHSPVRAEPPELEDVSMNIDTIVDGLKHARSRYSEIIKTEESTQKLLETLSESYNRIHSEFHTFMDLIKGHKEDNGNSTNILNMLKNDYDTAYTNILQEMRTKTADKPVIKQRLEGFQKLVLTGMREFVPPESVKQHLCPICFDKEVNSTINPCGHTYCFQCVSRVKCCPLCKTNILFISKIFFSL